MSPVGYDCTGEAVTAASDEAQTAVLDPFDGRVLFASGKWNPFDVHANHLGAIRFRDNYQDDDNVSAHLNFEWDLDWKFMTSLQFGLKYADREKDVSTQNVAFQNNISVLDREDPDFVYSITGGFQSIRLTDMLSGEPFPYDNFAEDLVSDRSNAFFGGWPMLDSNKAIAAYLGRDPGTVRTQTNPLGTRNIRTETQAAFLKLNFEGADGRLTGNVGLRFVKDSNEANGFGGIDFQRATWLFDPYDLFVVRQLGNMDLAPCPEPVRGELNGNLSFQAVPANDAELRNCYDWAVTHAYQYNNADTIPYVNGQWVYGDPSINQITIVDYSTNPPTIVQNGPLPGVINDVNGNPITTSTRLWVDFRGASQTWQYKDLSTAFTGPNGNVSQTWSRQAVSSGSAQHELLLPSLNLNYALNDEMIVRFAASRTMTRPAFDALNPRLSINENVWGPTANGSAGNASLKPLKSTNIDVSWEWYFNDDSMFSAALFLQGYEGLPGDDRYAVPLP